MPLLDHFHPPSLDRIPWTSLHAAWATHLANNLNERWLPDDYIASEEAVTAAHPEIDVATYHDPVLASPPGDGNGSIATAAYPRTFTVRSPDMTFPLKNRISMNSVVPILDGKRTLVGIIVLISPSNQDRPSERQGFAAKIASHVLSGVSVVIIDIVTNMRFNLHNGVVDLFEVPEARLPADTFMYAASYRPKVANEEWLGDIWRHPLAIGQPLPTMPLRLTGDTFVPVEFEETYVETCRRRKLI